MSLLLDTNVVSELQKPAPSPHVWAWWSGIRTIEVYLSVLTIGEIRRGIERLRPRDSLRAEGLDRWLGGLQRDYVDRIIPITAEIADVWGRFNASRTLPAVDSLMAATASVLGLTLVTRNVPDFVAAGIPILNPFD